MEHLDYRDRYIVVLQKIINHYMWVLGENIIHHSEDGLRDLSPALSYWRPNVDPDNGVVVVRQ